MTQSADPLPTTRTQDRDLRVPGWVWASGGLLVTICGALIATGIAYGELRQRVYHLERSLDYIVPLIIDGRVSDHFKGELEGRE